MCYADKNGMQVRLGERLLSDPKNLTSGVDNMNQGMCTIVVCKQ